MDETVARIQERLRRQLGDVVVPAGAYRDLPIVSFEEVAGLPAGAEGLVERVIEALEDRGLRVVHLRRAPIASNGTPRRRVTVTSTPAGIMIECARANSDGAPGIGEMIHVVQALGCAYDVIVGENFGFVSVPKILLTRKVQEGFNLGLPNVRAYVSDRDAHATVPCLRVEDVAGIAGFVIKVAGVRAADGGCGEGRGEERRDA